MEPAYLVLRWGVGTRDTSKAATAPEARPYPNRLGRNPPGGPLGPFGLLKDTRNFVL